MNTDTESPGRVPGLAEVDYQRLAQAVLATVEAQVDAWLQQDVIDIDSHRTGGLLELSLPDCSKVVINLQPPLQELWLATRAAGRHFRWHGGHWRDTRDGREFFAVLSEQLSLQTGQPLKIEAQT